MGPQSLTALCSYILAVVIFAAYFPVFYGRTRIRNFFSKHFKGEQVEIASYLFEKFSGVALMLGIPVIFFTFYNGENYLFTFYTNKSDLTNSLPWYVLSILIPLALSVNFFNARKPAGFAQYPQMRIKNWSWSTLFLYLFGWCAYIFAYEYLFRGVLFWNSEPVMSLWLNIALNCILYALAHIPKGMKEIIGSLFFGVILCLITLFAGGFWPAFILHFVLASSNSIFALSAHPEFKFNWKKI